MDQRPEKPNRRSKPQANFTPPDFARMHEKYELNDRRQSANDTRKGKTVDSEVERLQREHEQKHGDSESAQTVRKLLQPDITRLVKAQRDVDRTAGADAALTYLARGDKNRKPSFIDYSIQQGHNELLSRPAQTNLEKARQQYQSKQHETTNLLRGESDEE